MQEFRKLDLNICILNLDAKQLYFKSQATNFKNKKVTANPKPQTLKTIDFQVSENPKP